MEIDNNNNNNANSHNHQQHNNQPVKKGGSTEQIELKTRNPPAPSLPKSTTTSTSTAPRAFNSTAANTAKKIKKKNSYDSANWLSKLYSLYGWKFLQENYRKDFGLDAFDQCSKRDECSKLGNRLRERWNKELEKGPDKASLLRATMMAFWRVNFWCSIINFVVYGLIRMIMPMLLGRLIYFANKYREEMISDDPASLTDRNGTGTESASLQWLDSLTVSTDPSTNALFYAVMLCTAILLNFLLSHPYFMENFRTGLDVRVALTKLIYEKSLRVSQTAIQRMTIGRIVNLISTDASRFDVCFCAIYFGYCALLHWLVAMVLLYFYIGNALFGVLIMILFYIPFQVIMANILSRFRSQSIQLTDDRLRLMAEILPAMRVIKMYCWERPFAHLVHLARKLEIHKIQQSMILRSINLAFFFVSNKLMAFICFIWFLQEDKQELTAEIVFVSLSLIFQIRESMTFFFPMAISYGVESYISLKRIEKFLLEEEKPGDSLGELKTIEKSKSKSNLLKTETAIATNAYISLKSVVVRSELDRSYILNDISFDVTPGKLTVIIGQVGSGKSSILLSILKELRLTKGSIKTNGSIIYASQEAWIFSGTVQQNILFGKQFDSKRYGKVIKVAALESDLEQMPQGDQTMVEDRGTSLSGGQRARISLARALYTDSDCYLLDDPLSAVDTAVAKHIFEKCIKKYLRNKVVILVTHQLQFIKQADQIVVLNSGECLACGSYESLLKKGIDVYKYAATEPTNEPQSMISEPQLPEHIKLAPKGSFSSIASGSQFLHRIGSFKSDLFRPRTTSMISAASSLDDDGSILDFVSDTQLVSGGGGGENPAGHYKRMSTEYHADDDDSNVEKSRFGAKTSSLKIYWTYIRMGAGLLLLTTFILSNILCQLFYTGTDYWLSEWTEYIEMEHIQETNPNITFIKNPLVSDNHSTNIATYSFLVSALFVLAIVRTTSFFITCMRSSVNLHNTMFSSLIQAPILFFDKTPVGIIMNRVSRDMGIIDDLLPPVAFEALEILGNSLAVFILCASLNYFILIPFVVLAILLYLDIRFYVNTARNIRRLEAQARSPLFTQMATTLVGLPTIRSYHAEDLLLKRFTTIQNVHSSVYFTFLSTSRLFGISMEVMCLAYIYCLIIFLVANLDVYSGSIIGLTISQSLSLTSTFNWGVRQSTEVETYMTSVERIIEFSKLERENLDEAEIQPYDDWPPRGEIIFQDVSLQYNINDEPVLKNLSFQIQGGEKIGIVGRTGAGKSSIINVLFRLTKPSGFIYIDGLDTSKISLSTLRKNLSIIPQEPILFSGTIRRNLDPFNEKSDVELWDAIEKVQLKKKIQSLDSPVSESGNDFSVGQKQLICLARAIVRRNRILVLDEATANVDPRTDSFIQETIRTEFESCTVITIAHRLNTIIDYDRVLVLDHGKLMQFDKPINLIEQQHGIFYELFNNLSADMKSELKRIAKLSQQHSFSRHGSFSGSGRDSGSAAENSTKFMN